MELITEYFFHNLKRGVGIVG